MITCGSSFTSSLVSSAVSSSPTASGFAAIIAAFACFSSLSSFFSFTVSFTLSVNLPTLLIRLENTFCFFSSDFPSSEAPVPSFSSSDCSSSSISIIGSTSSTKISLRSRSNCLFSSSITSLSLFKFSGTSFSATVLSAALTFNLPRCNASAQFAYIELRNVLLIFAHSSSDFCFSPTLLYIRASSNAHSSTYSIFSSSSSN